MERGYGVDQIIGERHPTWLWYACVIGSLHGLGLILLLPATRTHPALLGLGFLAYTLGLRHAFDPDHIAAIDNAVRKLVQQRRDAVGVGFFFALGHSTVVFLMALATALITRWTEQAIPHLKEIGGILGTTVSGSFLILLGLINLLIWMNIYSTFQSIRRGQGDPEALERHLVCGGLIVRLAAPLFRFIGTSWHVYPVGLLFGFGFDTASEVTLLALSAGAAASQLPLGAMLALPVFFAAGMSLMDTADGVLVTAAYRWALATQVRKVCYNLTVTGLSVVAALVIGLIELIQVLMKEFGLATGGWKWLKQLDFGAVGYLLVALFVLAWALSYGRWRLFRLEERSDWQRSHMHEGRTAC